MQNLRCLGHLHHLKVDWALARSSAAPIRVVDSIDGPQTASAGGHATHADQQHDHRPPGAYGSIYRPYSGPVMICMRVEDSCRVWLAV